MPKGEQRQTVPVPFDPFSSLASLFMRSCRGPDPTEADSPSVVAVTVSSGGCWDLTPGAEISNQL